MDYRLLIDLDTVVALDSQSKRQRLKLLSFFEQIREYPERCSFATERDDRGQLIHVASHAGWLIYYWADFADRHVKILKIRRVI